MDAEQRFAEASTRYQMAMQRVVETPPPAGQKFMPGTRVKIADDLGFAMAHFPAGTLATVLYTYAHAYGASRDRDLKQYCLDVDGRGSVAWYDEEQLEPI